MFSNWVSDFAYLFFLHIIYLWDIFLCLQLTCSLEFGGDVWFPGCSTIGNVKVSTDIMKILKKYKL